LLLSSFLWWLIGHVVCYREGVRGSTVGAIGVSGEARLRGVWTASCGFEWNSRVGEIITEAVIKRKKHVKVVGVLLVEPRTASVVNDSRSELLAACPATCPAAPAPHHVSPTRVYQRTPPNHDERSRQWMDEHEYVRSYLRCILRAHTHAERRRSAISLCRT
jgi:hypothetical protein